VGRSPGSRAILVATGMHKWGLSNGTAAAVLLSDLIAGRDNPWAEVFDARRIGDVRAVAAMVKDNLKVGKEFTTGTSAGSSRAAPITWRSVRADCWTSTAARSAAYRDPRGPLARGEARLHPPGLPTGLEHGADKSWDCSCHGSRSTRTER
jgi:hypothetical protein